MSVELPFHPIAVLPNWDDCCGDLPRATNDITVVETAIGQQKVDLEGIGLDAVEDNEYENFCELSSIEE